MATIAPYLLSGSLRYALFAAVCSFALVSLSEKSYRISRGTH